MVPAATRYDTAFTGSAEEMILSFNLFISTRMSSDFVVRRLCTVIFDNTTVINSM